MRANRIIKSNEIKDLKGKLSSIEDKQEKNISKDVAEKQANIDLGKNSNKEDSTSLVKVKTDADEHLKHKAEGKEEEERSTRIKVPEKKEDASEVSSKVKEGKTPPVNVAEAGMESAKEKEEYKQKPSVIIPPDPGKSEEDKPSKNGSE